MIRIIVAVCMCFYSSTVLAQVKVKGKIVDAINKPVELAEIFLIDKDSTVRINDLTNKDGEFMLNAETGEYLLKVKQLGNVLWTKKIVIIHDVNIGSIKVKTGEEKLKEVVITTHKKIIQRKVDRLVYNVENTISSQGMNGLDALRNTPLLRVDDKDGISIIGKSTVAVMINDKMIHLSGMELSNYLQSIKSDNIAKIEVITTPPAKYEAQGNSGIINIILKTNPYIGWSGRLSTGIQKNTQLGTQNDLTLNYQQEKFNFSVVGYKYKNGFSPLGTRDLIIETGDQISTKENRVDVLRNGGVDINAEYKLNNRSKLSMMLEYYKSHYDMDTEAISLYKMENTSKFNLNTISQQRWTSPSLTFDLFYDVKLDTLGKKMGLSGNILKSNSDKFNKFFTLNTENQDVNDVLATSNINYGIYSGQIDFTLPYKWITIETGAKFTQLNNISSLGYADYIEDTYIKDPEKSTELSYTENNSAIYFSTEKQLNSKWSTKAGLRYELADIESISSGSKVFNKRYAYLFPTFYLTYDPNGNNNFSINFSTRINRPSLQAMNPSRWYSNPLMYFEGNINLGPAISYNTEVSYTIKSKLTFTMYNQYITNENVAVPQLDGDIYRNTFRNGYNKTNTGLTVSYYDTFFSAWELSASASVFNTIAKPIIPELVSMKQYSGTYSINNTVNLNKAKTIAYNIGFFHNLPTLIGTAYVKDIYGLSSGIRMSFFEKNLKVNFTFSDILRTIKSDGYTLYDGYKEYFTQYNDRKKVSFNCNYSFGNKKVKQLNQSRSFEENKRKN